MKFLLILVTTVLTACSSNPPSGPVYQDNYYQGGSGAYLNGGPRVIPAGDVNSMTLVYNKYPNASAQQPCQQCRPQWRQEHSQHHHHFQHRGPQNYQGPYQRTDYRQPRPLPPVQQMNVIRQPRVTQQQPQPRAQQGSPQQRAPQQHGNGARF